MHANDYDLDIDAPEKLAPQLRAIADHYRESAAELASAWCDPSAGKVWEDYARILDRAAASAERAYSKRLG